MRRQDKIIPFFRRQLKLTINHVKRKMRRLHLIISLRHKKCDKNILEKGRFTYSVCSDVILSLLFIPTISLHFVLLKFHSVLSLRCFSNSNEWVLGIFLFRSCITFLCIFRKCFLFLSLKVGAHLFSNRTAKYQQNVSRKNSIGFRNDEVLGHEDAKVFLKYIFGFFKASCKSDVLSRIIYKCEVEVNTIHQLEEDISSGLHNSHTSRDITTTAIHNNERAFLSLDEYFLLSELS